MSRTITVILRCSTAERETLHVEVGYILWNLSSPDTTETEIIPEQPPAMRALNYLRPLDLRKVVGLKMEGIVGECEFQRFKLCCFLQRMPTPRRAATGDGNKEIFCYALRTMRRSASAVVEEV